MSLASLIKKGSLRGIATATPATPATHGSFRSPTVATIATVAVANAPDRAANSAFLDELPKPTPPEPKRIFKDPAPWLNPAQQAAAQAYNAHHFNCPQCVAAGYGQRYGNRCGVGVTLWSNYTESV